jgi:hypothetical protein
MMVPGTLEYQRLRAVQASKIGRTARFIRPMVRVEQVLRFRQKRAGFFKEGAALLLHRSMPSARMAYISGMRGSL